MLHSKRIWSIFPAESTEWLAKQLTQCTYCGCNGFQLGKYVFVNDATCPDGAQEYAVNAGLAIMRSWSLVRSFLEGIPAFDAA